MGSYRKIVGGQIPISAIVQHNVEWDRLEAFGVDSAQIKKMGGTVFEMVDEVIAVSEDDKALMVEAGIDTHKTTVIPHGVDCSLFEHSNSSTISLLELLGKEEQKKKDISMQRFSFFMEHCTIGPIHKPYNLFPPNSYQDRISFGREIFTLLLWE